MSARRRRTINRSEDGAADVVGEGSGLTVDARATPPTLEPDTPVSRRDLGNVALQVAAATMLLVEGEERAAQVVVGIVHGCQPSYRPAPSSLYFPRGAMAGDPRGGKGEDDMIQASGIDHIVLHVSDVERAKKFYAEVL